MPANPNDFVFPPVSRSRGVGFWLRPQNLIAARRDVLRRDHSNEWRLTYHQRVGSIVDQDVRYTRSMPFTKVVDYPKRPLRRSGQLRIALLADTGDGDRSQYGLLPLLRHVDADLMILNGDIAYPAGRLDDYIDGFFKPYNDLGFPVWAVPGNHEYYSRNRGQEFFDIFCSWDHAGLWTSHGLRLCPQPGSYWELAEPEKEQTPIAIIGLDTGKSGDLDGARKRHQPAQDQHVWLDSRLRLAQQNGRKVIVLFHIPSLVNERHDGRVHLRELHSILARYECVKFVTCGHIHNFQYYHSQEFGRYLAGMTNPVRTQWPDYIVCGGGGAYLSTTAFGRGRYPATTLYPTPSQWKQYAKIGWRAVEAVRLGRTVVGRLAATFKEKYTIDADVSDYLSFLLIDIELPGQSARVTPVYMSSDGLSKLYGAQRGAGINIQNRYPPVDPNVAEAMIQSSDAIRL